MNENYHTRALWMKNILKYYDRNTGDSKSDRINIGIIIYLLWLKRVGR